MIKFGTLRHCAAWMACAGMLSPAALFGNPPSADRSPAVSVVAKDVVLGSAANLRGQVVDTKGTAISGMEVIAVAQGRELARSTTNAEGQFELFGLNGGMVEVRTNASHEVVRLWTPTAAPPVASDSVLLVQPAGMVVRGQYADPACAPQCAPACPPACPPCGPTCGPAGAFGWLANPWVIGAAIAAAVAIPLALSDDDEDAS